MQQFVDTYLLFLFGPFTFTWNSLFWLTFEILLLVFVSLGQANRKKNT
jgi:hypothetical protein